MRSQSKKTILVLIGSLFLVVAFQNCSQAGSVTENATDFSKITDPLVVDVVNEIENQEIKEQEQIKEEIAKEETQIVVVDDSLETEQPATPIEQVLEDYSCDDNKGKANEKKVLVCHYPPGNAAARHEICISENALKAHQSHGHSSADHQDHLGKCVAGE